MPQQWEFWIDVGGTFTDCVARSPEGVLHTCKVLSSGVTKGRVGRLLETGRIKDRTRCGERDAFWEGYSIRFLDPRGKVMHVGVVRDFLGVEGQVGLVDDVPDPVVEGMAYELDGGEEAPVLAIRSVLGLRLNERIPPVSVRLGTTRGTNALLTRQGARAAFVTTKGFADVLLIGNQDRPRLFDLAIQKPDPLFEQVVEIDERLDAEGAVLRPVDAGEVRRQLLELKRTGVESIGICLLHSFANNAHELVVERVAREVGFDEVSVSSRIAPLIKIVSRGDTTMVDAYLNPVLRQYVQRLAKSLPGSEMRLMTSAGGLVLADHFVGKDSILSGPAGGVIGFSRVARLAGYSRAIGFDMGGTSTDVARFDGSFDYEFETVKGGVRVVAPMLAVETVAAGGGSICGFDGVKLHVGPRSAGADPGPACYGKGGPLTVTDINLFLGRILPERFPFPLDLAVVQRRLRELCDEIAQSPLGKEYSPEELAEGFRQIANENMVRAIRRISVAKGYDPADYVLVSFGGAGAQHVCAVARLLGARRVLVHPYSGILSAYGIGLADVRRFAERSLLMPLTSQNVLEARRVFEELAAQARAEVLGEGVSEAGLRPPVRWLELRYIGVDATILVEAPEDDDWRTAYEERHRQLYGYCHAGREIEMAVARVEVVGEVSAPPDHPVQPVERAPEPCSVTLAVFEGQAREVNVYLRDQLRPGDSFRGPAIVCEPTSTVVVDPGFCARIEARGELLLVDEAVQGASGDGGAAAASGEAESPSVDPIRLEIFNNLFASVAEQMGVTLQRTSISTNVKERLDFSCAIFTPEGDLVVNAPHIPVHLGAMSETVKRLLADVPKPGVGDVYVTNDPFRGGSHLPDVTVITPVHDEESGQLIFLTASRAHHSEIGGIVPGSMPPFSANLAEEGVVIPLYRLVEDGSSREAGLRELLAAGPYPSRSIANNMADITAQVAANHSGVLQLRELVARHGLATVMAYMQHIQRAAAEKMRMALGAMPDGVYERSDHLDDGSLIQVRVSIQGEHAEVDFTGTGPVLASNLNANRAITTAATLYAFRCLIREDIPLNSGVLDPVRIVLPECLLNPRPGATPATSPAMVGGNVETSQRVVDVLLGALGVAAASQGTMNNLTFGDGSFGYYETICGGSGATPKAAGADAVHTHMTNTRLTDAEVLERRYPVRVQEFGIRRGSGGGGQRRGGDGIRRRLEFLRPLTVSLLTERRGDFRPFGLEGGGAGAAGRNLLRRRGSRVEETLPAKVQVEVEAGDVMTIETPGGGGFGFQQSGG